MKKMHYKIIKNYRGGYSVYYASKTKKLTHAQWQEQLEHWGEHTDGGSNYGYRISFKPIKKIPNGGWIREKRWEALTGKEFYISKRIRKLKFTVSD